MRAPFTATVAKLKAIRVWLATYKTYARRLHAPLHVPAFTMLIVIFISTQLRTYVYSAVQHVKEGEGHVE